MANFIPQGSSEAVGMSSQADVVKKANLKLKVLKSKNGPASAGLQGPKVFKEFWFVFRALIGGDKILEYHQNERKFQECPAYPKGVLHLGSAMAVAYHNPEKKQQFSIELAGGSIIFLEAATQALAREWTTCLNAVLFGKGSGPSSALQYYLEVPTHSRLQYEGPCMLEVRDEELTVKTNDGSTVIVSWKLAHIRSFKAKKDMLTVYSGSRSSTGVGEYYFKTSQSVQITHAIETVVKKLKLEALGSNQQTMIPQHSMAHSVSAPLTRVRPFTSERRRPLPPPPPPSHPAPSPTPSPPCSPSRLSPSECSVTSSMAAVPDHIPSEVVAQHENTCHTHNRKYIPNFRTPEYSTVGEPTPGVGYQRLEHGVSRSTQKSVSPPHQLSSGDGYSHLSHQTSGPSLPPRNPSRSRSVSRSPPPPLPPNRPRPPPSGEYGKLDHGEGDSSGPPVEEGYGKLDHRVGGQANMTPSDEDYGRLDHRIGAQANFPPNSDEYRKLDHGIGAHANFPPSSDEYRKLDHGVGAQANFPPNSDEYRKLDHGIGAQANFPPSSDEYRKLDHGVGAQANFPPSSEDYGRLDHSVAGEKGLKEGYARLGTASPPMSKQQLPPPPVPTPYKLRPSSPMAKILQEMNTESSGGHAYSEVSVAGEGGGTETVEYSEVSRPDEDYGRLNHTAAPQLSASTTNAAAASSSRQTSIRYGRPGLQPYPQPRPQSTIDPYASLSDASINEITAAIRDQEKKDEDGDYSRLKLVAPSGPAHEVDSLGYCRPWTSFTAKTTGGVATTTGGVTNNTPKPSEGGVQKSVVNQTYQNGTEMADATYSAVGTPEFESLYDRMAGSEDTPPAPPPRRGSRHSRSHSPPGFSRGRSNKHPLPPPPQPGT